MGLQRVGLDLAPTLRSHKMHAFWVYLAWFLGLSQSWVNITAAYPKKPNVWDLTPSGPFSSWQPQICVWDSLRPHGLEPTRLLFPWNFPGRTTGVGYHALLQGSFPTQGWNPVSCTGRWTLYHWVAWEATTFWLCVYQLWTSHINGTTQQTVFRDRRVLSRIIDVAAFRLLWPNALLPFHECFHGEMVVQESGGSVNADSSPTRSPICFWSLLR